MPFETATSGIIGIARWRKRHRDVAGRDPAATAMVRSAERHATKWMRVSAAAHLGLATNVRVPKSRSVSGSTIGASDTTQLPYWMQADEALNTKAAWGQRAKLRRHPEVVAKLDVWWQCALRSVQSGDAGCTTLDQQQYVRLSRLLHKAMIQVWDEEDAQACALQDWGTDAAGRTSIDEKRFHDCIFELADICAPLPTPSVPLSTVLTELEQRPTCSAISYPTRVARFSHARRDAHDRRWRVCRLPTATYR